MKKLLAIMLCLVMLASLGAGAFAEEELSYDTEPGGFRFTVPDEMKNTAGVIEFFPCARFNTGTDVFITGFNYIAMTPEEYDVWLNSISNPKITDEELDRLEEQYDRAYTDLFNVIVSATPELAEFYHQATLSKGYHPERTKLGEADGFIFELYDVSPDYKENIDAWKAPFAEEFPRLYAALKDALTKAELFAPETPDPFQGLKLSFETTDLDGNPVKSEDLFKQNKITMLNLWATWCSPCKGELKDLGEIDRRLQEKGCGIVGMLYDSEDEGAIEAAKALLAENHADYLNLTFPEGFEEKLEKDHLSFPTSLMVDSSGTVLASIVEAAVDAYEPLIDQLLGEGQTPAEATGAGDGLSFDTEAAGFRFILPDEFGNIEGDFALGGCDEVGGLYPDVYLTEFYYEGLPEDTFNEMNDRAYAEDITDEELDALLEEMDRYMLYPLTVVTAGSKELEEAFYHDEFLSESVPPKRVLIAEKDGYVYYLYDYSDVNEAKLSNLQPEFVEEYRALEAAIREALAKAEFFTPPVSDATANKGVKLSFKTTDLDGNPVKSEELFQQNEITMLNVWATWCGPCIGELEFLGELDGRLKDLNCSVVGILYDGDEEGAVEAGKALLAERHAEYLNLMPPKGLDEMVRIGGYPTSLLVDRSGTVLACIVGANTEAYEPVIQNLLASKTESGSPS